MVTISDVAKEAGVSKTTVSYVLSGSNLISARTTTRVRAAMKKLGYSVNHAARVLSTARTNTIGIFAPPHKLGFFSLSLGGYLYSLSRSLRNYGYDTMLLTDEDGVAALYKAVQTKRIDGAILMDILLDDPRVEAAKELGFPTVSLGMSAANAGIDSVDTDFEYSAAIMIEHLADMGHHDVLFIGWPKWMYEQAVNYAVRFRDSALDEAERRGMTLHIVPSQEDALGSSQELTRALRSFPSATAMIIHNDAVVVVAPQTLRDLGIKVPQDISIEAIMPDQMGIGMQIPYTGVNIDLDVVANRTVETLVRTMQNADAPLARELVRHPLRERGSVRALG